MGIEKSIPGITDCHHKACQVMTKSDREGRIFLSNPHTNNVYFFLLDTKYFILYWEKNGKKASKNPEYAQMRHGYVILTFNDVTDRRGVSVRPTWGCSFFYLSQRLLWVCEINRIYHSNVRAHHCVWKRCLPSLPLNGGPEG